MNEMRAPIAGRVAAASFAEVTGSGDFVPTSSGISDGARPAGGHLSVRPVIDKYQEAVEEKERRYTTPLGRVCLIGGS